MSRNVENFHLKKHSSRSLFHKSQIVFKETVINKFIRTRLILFVSKIAITSGP